MPADAPSEETRHSSPLRMIPPVAHIKLQLLGLRRLSCGFAGEAWYRPASTACRDLVTTVVSSFIDERRYSLVGGSPWYSVSAARVGFGGWSARRHAGRSGWHRVDDGTVA